MLAGFAYQPVGFTLGKLATAVKNPYAAFLSKRCCGMEGAQCYPATFTFEFEGVAAFETEFVPDGLGNDEAIGREKEIKKMTRRRKISLIESINPEWKDLSAE